MPSASGHNEVDDRLPSRLTQKESLDQISEANTKPASQRWMCQQARMTWRVKTDNNPVSEAKA
jgi:hypothetical protein